MTPAAEQRLRLQIGLGSSIAGSIAMAATQRDPAAGQTIAIALSDITTKHWDHYKSVYNSLKGNVVGAAGDAGPEITKEQVDAILASLAPEVPT